MKTFVISDPHFGHKNIINYCRPEFSSTEEMDGLIIKNWNKVVNPEDVVFVLGDLGLLTRKRVLKTP